jgi:predicted transcriptional regulator
MAMLSLNDQKRIDAIIDDVRNKTGLSYPKDDLLAFAKAFGISVHYSDLTAIGPTVRGIIRYDDEKLKTNPRIYISDRVPNDKLNFTLAHEIGHYFLHDGEKLKIDDFDYSNDSTEDISEETEANYFAASLLVPTKLLQVRVQTNPSINALADYFRVSTSAIESRLQRVGIS